ncbi:MAG TPA: flagellar biosynthetic protein FliQ [Candidatus Binatia bacterium]|nr:flagellar biosynthetic protein FliQ [Candidatus Binatia bacterium]
MSPDVVVQLGQSTLQTAVMVVAPLLIALLLVSLAINIVQVLTSLQDNTISSVPRLLATALGSILLMPWMLRRLVAFTLDMLGDFRPLVR